METPEQPQKSGKLKNEPDIFKKAKAEAINRALYGYSDKTNMGKATKPNIGNINKTETSNPNKDIGETTNKGTKKNGNKGPATKPSKAQSGDANKTEAETTNMNPPGFTKEWQSVHPPIQCETVEAQEMMDNLIRNVGAMTCDPAMAGILYGLDNSVIESDQPTVITSSTEGVEYVIYPI